MNDYPMNPALARQRDIDEALNEANRLRWERERNEAAKRDELERELANRLPEIGPSTNAQ